MARPPAEKATTNAYMSWTLLLRIIAAPGFFLRVIYSLFFNETNTDHSTENQTESENNQQIIVSRSPQKVFEGRSRIHLLSESSYALGYILSYLLPKELHIFVKIQRHGLFRTIQNDPGVIFHLCNELCRLIAIEGEDNQNKAESLLKASPNQASKIIATKISCMKDAAGRLFETPISAYGYAFWAGDTDMCLMLQAYMDESTKAGIFDECESIKRQGVSFTLDGEKVVNSHYWDWRPLIQACSTTLSSWDPYWRPLVHHGGHNEYSMAERRYWPSNLKLGKEQAKVPTRVAQLCCALKPLDLRNFLLDDIYQTTRTTSLALSNLTPEEFKRLKARLTNKKLLISTTDNDHNNTRNYPGLLWGTYYYTNNPTEENYQFLRYTKSEVQLLRDALSQYPELSNKLIQKPDFERTTKFYVKEGERPENWFSHEGLGISFSIAHGGVSWHFDRHGKDCISRTVAITELTYNPVHHLKSYWNYISVVLCEAEHQIHLKNTLDVLKDTNTLILT